MKNSWIATTLNLVSDEQVISSVHDWPVVPIAVQNDNLAKIEALEAAARVAEERAAEQACTIAQLQEALALATLANQRAA